MKNELTPGQLKPKLKMAIKNNRDLAKIGIMPTAYELIGEAGISKTSLIAELAREEEDRKSVV